MNKLILMLVVLVFLMTLVLRKKPAVSSDIVKNDTTYHYTISRLSGDTLRAWTAYPGHGDTVIFINP